MPVPGQLRELLKEWAQIQANPISERALAARMATEATTWINAAHVQHRRVTAPVGEPGEQVWRQEIDLHFLLVALIRLRRSVDLATRVPRLQTSLRDRLAEFDKELPSLALLRNVAEHFDDYTVNEGRRSEIKRHQLQVWSLGADDDGLVWRWLGVEFNVEVAHRAATKLYRGFHADLARYSATDTVRSTEAEAALRPGPDEL